VVIQAVEANANEGLRRTNEDKRKSVLALLGIEEWANRTNVAVALKAGVDESTVRDLRAKTKSIGKPDSESPKTRKTSRGNRPATYNTAKKKAAANKTARAAEEAGHRRV
jgi:hypothetical protein